MKMLLVTIIGFYLLSCNQVKQFYNIKTKPEDILYIGVQNAVFINSVNSQPLNISINNGTILNIDSNLYMITVTNFEPTLLTISQGKLNETLKFRTKSFPKSIFLHVETENDLEVENQTDATTFQGFTFLVPTLYNFDYESVISLNKYNMTRIDSLGNQTTVLVDNPNKGPNKSNYLAKKACAGDTFIFSEISIDIWYSLDHSNAANETIQLNDYVVRIK